MSIHCCFIPIGVIEILRLICNGFFFTIYTGGVINARKDYPITASQIFGGKPDTCQGPESWCRPRATFGARTPNMSVHGE